MSPTIRKSPLLDYLVTDFLMRGGKIEQLQYGNSVRPDDGEDWKTINENSYKIRMDKGESV